MKKWALVNFCEVDKFAEEGYCAIHNVDKSLNLGDITKVDIGSLESVDMITHGSPCQDFSAAGLQKGGDKGSGTSLATERKLPVPLPFSWGHGLVRTSSQ